MKIENIITDRLNIRGFQKEDALFAFSICNDPEMGQYLTDASNGKTDEEYLRILEGLGDDDECCYLIAELKETHERIGTCSFIPSEDGEIYDIAYCVHKKYWRNGYATEMIKGMIKHAKSNGAKKITVKIDEDNEASNGVVNKLGFHVAKKGTYIRQGTHSEAVDLLYELNI